MAPSYHHSETGIIFVLQKGVAPKNDERQNLVFDSLNEIKKLEFDFLQHDYMHMKGHGRGPGSFENLEVMVNLHMVSIDLIKFVRRQFMSMRFVYFLIHFLMLMHD